MGSQLASCMDDCENAGVNELATESEGELPSANAVVQSSKNRLRNYIIVTYLGVKPQYSHCYRRWL